MGQTKIDSRETSSDDISPHMGSYTNETTNIWERFELEECMWLPEIDCSSFDCNMPQLPPLFSMHNTPVERTPSSYMQPKSDISRAGALAERTSTFQLQSGPTQGEIPPVYYPQTFIDNSLLQGMEFSEQETMRELNATENLVALVSPYLLQSGNSKASVFNLMVCPVFGFFPQP